MIKNDIKSTIFGMRSGNTIQYTCPNCLKENTITFNMPQAFYKESRNATCSKCRSPYIILTPGRY